SSSSDASGVGCAADAVQTVPQRCGIRKIRSENNVWN
ncbi:hypothetical protein GWI33_012264, partial [Rhynchophorus ferrugineus]